MATYCLQCETKKSSTMKSSGKIRCSIVVSTDAFTRISSSSSVIAKNTTSRLVTSTANASSAIRAKSLLSSNVTAKTKAIANIRSLPKFNLNLRANNKTVSQFKNVPADKFGGNIQRIKSLVDFSPTQKLYPIKDIITDLNNSYFVDKQLQSGNLYSQIDEGVAIGKYAQHGQISSLISDEKVSYIQPSSVFTKGDFRYKFEVTRPNSIEESFLFIRAAAPTSNYSSNVPPQYRLHNIKLEDPSGNLILKYKDILIRGDADYSTNYVNFATYISEPEINNLKLNLWDDNYPLMHLPSGYSLNIDFAIDCLDDPFNEGFNKGYEDTCKLDFINSSNNNYLALDGSPLSTQTQNFSLNPTNSLRISAIEIANSGGVGSLNGNYLDFYTEVNHIGVRLTRKILPSDIITYNTDLGIYPSVSSAWQTSSDDFGNVATNTSVSGNNLIVSKIREDSLYNNISLIYSDPTSDSGRLTLKFAHTAPEFVDSLTAGAFDGAYANQYFRAVLQSIRSEDNYFVVDDIKLKIIAKKASGSRNYVLDILGFSDDKLLNVTSKHDAFLQNLDEGIGTIPDGSGFVSTDHLGIASESISDKDQYFEKQLINNPAGDHYKLSTVPIIDSTSFKEYIIPLKIYSDSVSLGVSPNYSHSSNFENLYLDIYNIPSGATIATAQLIVTYKPSNALSLSVFAQEALREYTQRNITLLPSSRQLDAQIFDTGYEAHPLSKIPTIPEAYSQSTKTNYSKRWRGVGDQIVNGPFDARSFDYCFYNPAIEYPFLQGYFNFANTSGNTVFSTYLGSGIPTYSGTYIGSLQDSTIYNLGNRLRNNDIFSSIPARDYDYRSIDWATGTNSLLSGKISDSFEYAIRTSGDKGYLELQSPIPPSSGVNFNGFGIYLRFTPDINNIGSGYNLFNSGIIFAKYDNNKTLDYVLCYEDEYLCLKYNNNQSIKDTKKYYEYSYPLSVLVTFGEVAPNPNQSLLIPPFVRNTEVKLYTSSDADNNELLKASGVYNFNSSNASEKFTIGHCLASGVGLNCFVHELGMAKEIFGTTSFCNITSQKPVSSWSSQILQFFEQLGISPASLDFSYYRNNVLKYILVEDFFKTISNKYWNAEENSSNDKNYLYSYIDEDVDGWKIGDFKLLQFSPDFYRMTIRNNTDYLTHTINSDGIGYLQLIDRPVPPSINLDHVSYHTQIENDFLRFYLADIPQQETFYATYPRISKNIPRYYNFYEDALRVETVLEHDTLDHIEWPDGNIGPKLIVSLYTINKDPVDRPSIKNHGLVSRSAHYLEPSGGIVKIKSSLTYEDILDNSEPWANFDTSVLLSEFDHKYMSQDINDMYLQYDLVYPSGEPFTSTVKLHSANIKLENAVRKLSNEQSNLSLATSGDLKSLSTLDFSTQGSDVINDVLNIFISGTPAPSISDSVYLYSFGAYAESDSALLCTFGTSSGISSIPVFIDARSDKSDVKTFNLFVQNRVEDQTAKDSLSLFTANKFSSGQISGNVSLIVAATPQPVNRYIVSSVNLYSAAINTKVLQDTNSLPLYIAASGLYFTSEQSLPLFTINYPPVNYSINQQQTITWNSNNPGKDIIIADNDQAYLEANDEIRGVELMCYGECDTSNNCAEDGVVSHELVWLPEQTCVDGGIMRAKNTYTNLATSGFKTDIGYSGNFYGIKKYDGLIPHAPYSIVIAGQTGSNRRIEQPFGFSEVEYGSNNYVDYSGTKISYLGNQNNNYGKSISIKNDLMVVGAPLENLDHQEYDEHGNIINYHLPEAGSVYVYRRSQPPSGYSWSAGADKSPWSLETKLMLPSGILKDYYNTKQINVLDGQKLPLPITTRYWEVGQEGRQFGHSVSVASTSGQKSFQEERREIAVIGAPHSAWQPRPFEDLQVSGVQIGIMIFTDEFTEFQLLPSSSSEGYDVYTYLNVLGAIRNKDLVFKYFSNPPVNFDVKLVICEPLSDYTNRIPLEFSEPKPSFIVKRVISRKQGILNEERVEKIVSGIKDAFHEAFPYDETKLNNNIPVILGVAVDSTRSMLNAIDGTTPALNRFISYYENYSFASGLQDFYGNRASGEVVKFNSISPQHWINLSVSLLDYVLDTGRLLQNNQVRFFSSGVGLNAVNQNLSMFNYPPDSGGKVFIFEKESGVWNLIQEIKSDAITYGYPDRFGHAVAISDNTEVIAIGSPYITESCQVYEYKPEQKESLFNQIFSWVSYKSSSTGGVGRYANLVENYYKWIAEYVPGTQFKNAIDYSNKTLYANLTQQEKFDARKDLNIKEYNKIFTYNQGAHVGSNLWGFIEEEFLPTPRLGYSAAVNEDGSIVAFGAPTDSLNQWDDVRVYYKNRGYQNPEDQSLNTFRIEPAWKSTVNAGAVRLFESRKYYPHNKVIEYGKFGNLQRELDSPQDSGHFNYLPTVFRDKNFEITPFAQVTIPQDAGLMFIITPSIDSLSDEVAENIINWLELGDRNLVLVGNDPIWEANGAYNESNNILNKILNKLDSRMKLYPARNEHEACLSGPTSATPVFVENATETYIQREQTNIYGVADIRTNFDNLGFLKDQIIYSTCQEETEEISLELQLVSENPNTKCELPIKNNGDLRATWYKTCLGCGGIRLKYAINLPYYFSTFTPACRCDKQKTFKELQGSRINAPNQEPVPLLAAARTVTETITLPSQPAVMGSIPITIQETLYTGQQIVEFDDTRLSTEPFFVWSPEMDHNITLATIRGADSVIIPDPSPIDGSSGVLQFVGQPLSRSSLSKKIVSPNAYYCVQENLYDSIIIAIAGTATESELCIYNAGRAASFAQDENINFYVNMVSQNLSGESRIVFLSSGWVGRSSFTDADNSSVLYEVFTDNGNAVSYRSKLYNFDDVCWIANPISLPSSDDLEALKLWLQLGNKRLIVTHDSTIAQMNNVNKLLGLLGSSIESLFLPMSNNYPAVKFDSDLIINRLSLVGKGFNSQTTIGSLIFSRGDLGFIPFKLNNNVIPIAYKEEPITDTEVVTNGYWAMSAEIKLSIPNIPFSSGYKLFINTAADTPYENQRLLISSKDVTLAPGLPEPQRPTGYNQPLTSSSNISTNFQSATTKPLIHLLISADNNIENVAGYIPKTPKIISISGVLLPLITNTITKTIQQSKIIGYQTIKLRDEIPERTITREFFDHIRNDNTQYCSIECLKVPGFANQQVADGPVVVAQEEEHITSFIAGHQRSRITLISDSSLVQGYALSSGTQVIPATTLNFLQSLYPNTSFATANAGRQFTEKTKIISPERASPQKYLSITKSSGINYRFGNGGISPINNAVNFNNVESSYDPQHVQYPDRPWPEDAEDQEIQFRINAEKSIFRLYEGLFSAKSKLRDTINGTTYIDVPRGLPDILKDTGKDYIDVDTHYSGYPGDLFGYSIALYGNKLVVGAPFVGFSDDTVHAWDYYIANSGSGINMSFNGGAGAAYIFEKTFKGSGLHGSLTPWEFTQKLRPKTINIGQDILSEDNINLIANHNYSLPFLQHNSIITDQFGYSVAIDSDVILVGAPGHDYSNIYINGNVPVYSSGYGHFIRKCFNEEFNIPSRQVIDLGSTENRAMYPNSGSYIINNGAIFTFENRIVDWPTKTKKWITVEKIVQNPDDARQGLYTDTIDGGYVQPNNTFLVDGNDTASNILLDGNGISFSGNLLNLVGSENARFGRAVAIDRTFRTDADYSIASAPLNNSSGYIYINDIMLRQPTPITQNKDAYIHARVFGERETMVAGTGMPHVFLAVTNSGQNSINYFASGTVFANNRGQIFIECSGQDPALKGFIEHRPFIASVDGQYTFGTLESGNLSLFVDGSNYIYNTNDLFTKVDNSAIVYNNLGMYNGGITDIVTSLPSGLTLYVNPDPKSVFSELNLFVSGIGLQSDALNMRIRGQA